jgi:diadenylate cyclase
MLSEIKAMESVTTAFWQVGAMLGQVGQVLWYFPWHHLIDIGLMTFIVYQVYIRFRGTRAVRIVAGIAVLGLGYLAAQAAGLFLTAWLFGGVWAATLIFVIVIFQGEIRQMLEQVNPRLPTTALLRWVSRVQLPEESLRTIAETVFALAAKRCGVLLVFERHDFLEPLLRSPGTVVDAQVSPELLETLFTPPTPLHDGALYLRGGRVYRAGCVLPLSENRRLASFYGTRHRAALGICEHSDALAVVVSEQRGAVSIAERRTLEVVHTSAELLTWLTDRLSARGEKPKRRWFSKALVTHNWRPKLAALAAVSLLWFVLVGRQDTEVGFSIPVVYRNVPKELTIDGKQVQEVYLRVRGSQEMLSFLDPSRLQVAIDLKEAQAGEKRYEVSTKDINLPLGLQLAEVNPSRIELRLRNKPPESNSKP